MLKKNLFVGLLWMFGIIVIIGFIFQLYNSYYLRPHKKGLIRDNMKVVNGGRVIRVTGEAKVSRLYNLTFIYTINGIEYSNEVKVGIGLRPNAGYYLSQRFVPVVYEASNPQNSFVLLELSDFSYFGISFPDSLQWVKSEIVK